MGACKFRGGTSSVGTSRFRQEAAVADLVRHPSIVRLLDVYYAQDKVHLVYELAGADLKSYVEASVAPGSALESGQIRDCLLQLLSALSHMHSKALVHTDVKPSNIFVRSPSPWLCVLGDLGCTVEACRA